MKRRQVLSAIPLALTSALAGCGFVTFETVNTEPVDVPDAAEALTAVGLPQPDAELTTTEGIRVSDLDEWSVRVEFTAEISGVDSWISAAFSGAEGLPVTEDGSPISQRLRPEDVTVGKRYFSGSNPADRSATYTVLISPSRTEVLVAAARTAR